MQITTPLQRPYTNLHRLLSLPAPCQSFLNEPIAAAPPRMRRRHAAVFATVLIYGGTAGYWLTTTRTVSFRKRANTVIHIAGRVEIGRGSTAIDALDYTLESAC